MIEHQDLTHQSSVSIIASELSNFKREAQEANFDRDYVPENNDRGQRDGLSPAYKQKRKPKQVYACPHISRPFYAKGYC